MASVRLGTVWHNVDRCGLVFCGGECNGEDNGRGLVRRGFDRNAGVRLSMVWITG